LDMINRVADRVTAINRSIFYDGSPDGLTHFDLQQQYKILG
jgi:hypothetical protein